MLATGNHAWTLSSPGLYTQTHDSFAHFFASWVAGESTTERTTLIIVSVVKINARLQSSSSDAGSSVAIGEADMQSRFRYAWAKMRHDHPGLAVEFGQRSNTYKVPSPEDITAWLDATFLVHPDLDARGLTRSLKREAMPRLHWLPKTNEVVLTAHHCYADARSLWAFWDVFLDKVVKACPSPCYIPLVPVPDDGGFKLPNLPPARDDLLGLPEWPTIPGWMKAHEMVMSAFKTDLVLLPPSTPAAAVGEPINWPAGPCDYVRQSLSENQTAAVVATCKAKGITVTAAFYAALASATRAIQAAGEDGGRGGGGGRGAGDDMQFPSITLISGRVDYHVVIPFALDLVMAGPDQAGTQNAATAGPHKERPLDELVQDVNRFFRSTRHEFGQDPTGLDALTYYVRSGFGPPNPASSTPTFSSLGVAEHFLRRRFSGEGEGKAGSKLLELEVEDTYIMTLGAKLMNAFMLHTFRGRMSAISTFDEEYFRAGSMESLLAKTFEKLFGWLEME
ncbi:hypothetical protein PG984_009035 [Apiospora sp. TS-2023a]